MKQRKMIAVLLVVLMLLTAVLAACVDEPADMTALDAAITEAETKVESRYTPASWATFKTALDAAKALNDSATQAQVDAATQALTTATTALQARAVFDNLSSAIAKAKELKESQFADAADYTALTSAISDGELVVANLNATQAQVDAALAAINTAMSKADMSLLAWTVPTQQYVLKHDIVRYRADRVETEVTGVLAGLVTATVNGEATQAAIDPATLPARDATTGLYTIGTHQLTFKARGADKVEYSQNYTINIVDGTTIDYYFYGVNSSIYATESGNGNWLGGEGIRVAPENWYILEGDATELADHMKQPTTEKFIDPKDPVALQNKTTRTITFKSNNSAGLHILMNSAGVVKFVHEGVQADMWTQTSKIRMLGSDFVNYDIELEPGDIYFAIGTPVDGNWYSDYTKGANTDATKEKHWKDGRFPARNTIGLGTTTAVSAVYNVAKVVKGDEVITDTYANILPGLYTGGGTITIDQGATLPNLLSDIAFYDFGATWAAPTQVVNPTEGEVRIVVDSSNVNTAVVGEYTVTYTVKDDVDPTQSTTYQRTVIVQEAAQTNYLSYVKADNTVVRLDNVSAVINYNSVPTAATGKISVYDWNYFNANKEDATKFGACNFGVYVIVDGEGHFVKSYLNKNMIDETRPYGADIQGAVEDAMVQARTTETLQAGWYILFFQQDANVQVRSFAQGLRDAHKGRIGQGAIDWINQDGTSMYAKKVVFSNNGTESTMVVRNYLYNTTHDATKGDVTIIDNQYTATNFNGFGWGYYIKVAADGKIVEIYDGANAAKRFNAQYPNGEDLAGQNSNILKDYDFTTLADGEFIIILPNNGHVAAGDNKPAPTSFAGPIKLACMHAETFNPNNATLSLVNIYAPVVEEHEHQYVWAITTPATYYAKGVETGTCSCNETTTRDIAQLLIENKQQLDEAITNAPANATIILGDNIDYQGKLSISSKDKAVSLTIDLGGHTLTAKVEIIGGSTSKADSYAKYDHAISVTIKNGTIAPSINDAGILVVGGDNTTAIVDNVRVTGVYYGITTNGTQSGATLTATNSTFTGIDAEGEPNDNTGAYLAAAYTYSFTNCQFVGHDGLIIKSGTSTFDGCTITANGPAFVTPKLHTGGFYVTGSAATVYSQSNYIRPVTATFQQCAFVSPAGYGLMEIAAASAGQELPVAASIDVSGATYTCTLGEQSRGWTIVGTVVTPPTVVVEPDGSKEAPYVAVVGTNTVTIVDNASVYYAFTATETKTYTISATTSTFDPDGSGWDVLDVDVRLYTDAQYSTQVKRISYTDGEVTYDMVAGTTYYVRASFNAMGSPSGSLSFTIS